MKKQKTILVVEDENSYKNILSEKLNKEGFTIFGASNGKDGLEVALKLHPDLIILDIEMPIVNGLAMLERLRKDAKGSDMKVIILSAYQDIDKISKAMDLGTYDYYIKTEIEIGALIKKIKETLV